MAGLYTLSITNIGDEATPGRYTVAEYSLIAGDSSDLWGSPVRGVAIAGILGLVGIMTAIAGVIILVVDRKKEINHS